ncbi:hypothetical protein [Streptomyces sp. NPDC053427]|uniref:hypothetical protein n=1 Tax=Streptomyces sp. NPDC053427 TaxID=3365701 RepID=UPI0037D970EA
MVMQDGGTVDVRPGSDPGRAAPEHSGAYLATGLCLALYGGALLAWILYGFAQGDGTVWDFVEALFNPGASPAAQVLGPYEWAFAVAFLAVAGLSLAQRRVARSAALLSAMFLLAVSLREGVGLFDATYRNQYSNDPLGSWALATRGLGLLAALVVLAVLLPAKERPAGSCAAPASDGPVARWRRLSRICGVLFLITAVFRIGWWVSEVTSSNMDLGRYLRSVVDSSVFGSLDLSASVEFTTVGSVVALLVLGVLALRGRRDIRGALLLFAAVELYLTVRMVVWLAVTDFFTQSFQTPEGALSIVTTAYALAAMTSVVVLATGRGSGTYGGLRNPVGSRVPTSE